MPKALEVTAERYARGEVSKLAGVVWRAITCPCASAAIALVLLSALTVPAAANHGSFQICNDEGTEYQVAVVYRSGFGLLMDEWTAQGWYTIPARGCVALFQPMSDALQMYVTVRAKGPFGYGDVAAPTFRTSGSFGRSVNESLCVLDGRFERKGPKWSHGFCSDPWIIKRAGIYLDVPAIPLRQHYSNILTLTGGKVSASPDAGLNAIAGWWPAALGALAVGTAALLFRRGPSHAGVGTGSAPRQERVRSAPPLFPWKAVLFDAIVGAAGIAGVVAAVTTLKLGNFGTSVSMALSLGTFIGIPALVALTRHRFRVGERGTWSYVVIIVLITLLLVFAGGIALYSMRFRPN